jgi:hypothetical protein
LPEEAGETRNVICKYLSYKYQLKDGSFRFIKLPLVHVRLTSTESVFESVALVDSGATQTLIPLELAEILELQYENKVETIGAGGAFQSLIAKLKVFEILKNETPFSIFRDVTVLVPESKDVLPYAILGRDHIFRRFDITFHERREKITFTKV